MKLTAALIRRFLQNAMVEANTKATIYLNLSDTSPDASQYKELYCTWIDRYSALKDFNNFLISMEGAKHEASTQGLKFPEQEAVPKDVQKQQKAK